MFKYLQQQFRQPKGFVGQIISVMMRKMNNKIYDVIIDKMAIEDGEELFEIGYGHGIGISKILTKKNARFLV